MKTGSKLFTYCIPADDGAAPNPFWGLCTLTICKPSIRRAASIGDWVVGTGSRNSPIGDVSGQVVYAMKVTKKLPMDEYDAFARTSCPRKVPEWGHQDRRRWLGDAIYDFDCARPRLRKSVHGENCRDRDLGGKYALISDHFFYFGDQPRPLPPHLLAIVRQGQGHQSRKNHSFQAPFLRWLYSLELQPNTLYGKPQDEHFFDRPACYPLVKEARHRATCSPCSPGT